MNKKGVSEVVTTLLIIVISIIAILIIWTAVFPSIKTSLEKGTSCSGTINEIKIEEDSFSCASENMISLSLERTETNAEGFAILLQTDSGSERIDIFEGTRNVNVRSITSGFDSPLSLPKVGQKKTYVFNMTASSAELYPLAGDNLCQISDSIVFTECSQEVQMELSQIPEEQNMTNVTNTTSGNSGSFQFLFQNDGLLVQLNWSSDGDDWKTIVSDEKTKYGNGVSYYLHSLTTTGYETGWTYLSPLGLVEEKHSQINYQKTAQTNNSVAIKAETSKIKVTDSIVFEEDTFIITSTIKNNLPYSTTVKVPFYLGGLQITGNMNNVAYSLNQPNTDISILRATKGGEIEKDFNNNGGSIYSYPSHLSFSPVLAIWDKDISLGAQYIDNLELPDSIDFTSRVKWAYGPNIEAFINTELAPGEQKTFKIAYKVSESNGESWKGVLEPYKEWFYDEYNDGTPEYCPTGPFAYFGGNNIGAPLYNPQTHRYALNTKFMDVFNAGQTLYNIEYLQMPYYGIWAATLYSDYLSDECRSGSCEFSPNSITLDPNLDVSSNPTKIQEAATAFASKGAKMFWYTRTCALIELDNYIVSEADLPLYGDYLETLDLRKAAMKNIKFAEYDYLHSHGINNFYIDTITCPGEDDFIDNLLNRYPETEFILREGARDTIAIKTPQLPIIKGNGVYPDSHSELINWLVPYGSYYLGAANDYLTDSEFTDVLNMGYQPVVSDSLTTSNAGTLDKFKDRMCAGYQNQLDKYEAYGSSVQGCSAPEKPSYC